MTTKVYESGLRAETCAGLISADFSERFSECVLLPIPSSRDGVRVTGTDVPISSALSEASAGTLVVGYGIPSDSANMARMRGAVVVDSCDDGIFLDENARLTAECALGIILTTVTHSLSDMRIGVVGYGRIGKYMTRLLLYLGCRVTVYTRRESVCVELGECGIGADTDTSASALRGLDLLINTAPAKIFDTGAPDFPRGLRIIELASGENFDGYSHLEKYPSLPARMLPCSAGRIWYESVKRLVGGGA